MLLLVQKELAVVTAIELPVATGVAPVVTAIFRIDPNTTNYLGGRSPKFTLVQKEKYLELQVLLLERK